ncbi:MAG: cadherin-like domain-containing protein [Pseudomonadota bacterium]
MTSSSSFPDQFSGDIPVNPASGGGWNGQFQKHHLIPTAQANSSSLLQGLSARGLYDHENFGSNGLYLPDDANDAKASGLARHAGSHPAYSNFVGNILEEIESDFERQRLSIGEDAAYKNAAANIEKFQLYLKDGLVARLDPETKTAYPRFLLNGTDGQIAGGSGGQDKLRNVYAQIDFTEIKQSQVFVSPGYREALKQSSALFDPNAENEFGQRLSQFERAALRDTDIAKLAKSLEPGKFNIFTKFLKDAGSGKADFFSAFIFGLTGIAYAKTTIDTDKALEKLQADIERVATFDNATSAAIGIVAGFAAVGAVSILFGTTGVVALIGLGAILSLGELRIAVGRLAEAFPNWNFIQRVDAFFASAEKELEVAFSLVLEAAASFPEFIVAEGETSAHGGDGVQFIYGSGNSALFGGGGEDYLLHTGFGALEGGAGDDVLIGLFPDFIKQGAKLDPANPDSGTAPEDLHLELDGGPGEDFIVTIGGNQPIILGGDGNDTIFPFSPGAVVVSGAGEDVVHFAPDVLFADASAVDGIYMGDRKLHGATGAINSESVWAITGLLRYTVNKDGELVINFAGLQMFVANYRGGNGVADPTAGITVFRLGFDAFLAFRGERAGEFSLNWFAPTLDLIAKALFGKGWNENWNDPLVLDLDGDGLELLPPSGSRYAFDHDGDGFGEPAGWVRPDDGLLALDRNGDGIINDIGELFGSVTGDGFADLAALDDNLDGRIDAQDSRFAELLVWQDANGNARSELSELTSLSSHGIVSISLEASVPTSGENAQNQILLSSTFERVDGSTSVIADVGFNIDDYNSVWLGDQTISARASLLPNIKGTGEFPDLHISLTLDEELAAFFEAGIETLTAQNLEDLREQATPLLVKWAASATEFLGKTPHISVPIKVRLADDGTLEVVDSAWIDDDFWAHGPLGAHLFCDLNPCPPTEAPPKGPIIIETGLSGLTGKAEWRWLEGGVITFLERHLGRDLPLEHPASTVTATQGGVAGLVEFALNRMDMVAVRLAMQGPLKPYFDGLEYSLEDNRFHATTDRMLAPMFEAIFARAPLDPDAATAYLEGWQSILDVVITEFDRGNDLVISYDFIMANIVAAYDTTGLPLYVLDAATALGVPRGSVLIGTDIQEGSEDPEILVFGAGDETAEGGAARDVYIVPRQFGSDTIIESEAFGDARGYDLIRFADTRADEVEAVREGLDLVLRVASTGSELRIVNQFEILNPGFFGGAISPEWGIEEISFVDGTVWDRVDIAWAVSRADPASTEVRGTPRPDVLDGGAGDDLLTGGNEGDIYLFDIGYGHDVIRELEGAQNALIDTPDFVLLGSGAGAPEDVTFLREGQSDDLIVRLASGETLTIEKQFHAFHTGAFGLLWQWRIENLIFDNGTFLDADGIMRRVLDDARSEGDDVIYGFHRDDLLDGGGGNDELRGGDGSDTYHFDAGDGADIIRDSQFNVLTSSDDTLRFGSGIGPDDLRFVRSGEDLEIIVGESGDSVLIEGQFTQLATGFGGHWLNRIERITFQQHPDVEIGWEDIMLSVLAEAATGGDDLIEGFTTGDVLDGGAGNDRLTGKAGADTYVFGPGSGADVIYEGIGADFGLGVGGDEVLFAGGLGPDDVEFAREGDDLIVDLPATGDRLIVEEQFGYAAVGHYTQQIEVFRFADGTVLSAAEIEQKLIDDASGPGDDVLRGALLDNVFDGGPGDDLLIGEDGSDIYRFGIGSGHDTIDEQPRWLTRDNFNVVEFGGGIASEDLTFERRGDDLLITLSGSGETLTVLNEFSARSTQFSKIQEYRFADGSTLERDEILALTQDLTGSSGDDTLTGSSEIDQIQGLAGDDEITGGAGDDLLAGGVGDDRLSGNEGSDTYLYRPGDGADIIEDRGSFGQDALVLDGIHPDDVALSRAGSLGGDLVLHFIDRPDDAITILGALAGSLANTIEVIRFVDGSEWTVADVRAKLLAVPATDGADELRGFSSDDLLQGLAGDDVIHGDAGDDILIGGPGNDRLSGNGGSDTYIFARGDGQDTIADFGFLSTDRLVIQGYDASEVVLARHASNDSHLLITFDGETDDQIVVEHALTDNRNNTIELISLQDGTQWTPDDVRRLILEQERRPGDETITGFITDDVLEGGDGSDTLHGGQGSDTYVFRRGDGADVIKDNGFLSSDVIRIHGYETSDVQFARAAPSSEDLLISFSDAPGDSILVKSTLGASKGDTIEWIERDDGTRLSTAEVRARILEQQASPFDDEISGFFTDDILDGTTGTDLLSGGDGSDTYVFTPGDGWTHIHDAGFNGTDVLQLNGIAPGEAEFSRRTPETDDLLILFPDTSSDRIVIENTLGVSKHDTVETIRLDDGTEWTIAEVRGRVLDAAGTAAADEIRGFDTDDFLIGRGGQDVLNGLKGSDTYLFAAGDGEELIRDRGDFGEDVLKISGYGAEEVNLSLRAPGSSDLVITFDTNPNDRIVIEETLSGSRFDTIERIELDDGNSWDASAYRAAVLDSSMTDGSDVVFGFEAAETIEAGAGTDLLMAGAGSDTYIYRLGDGRDIIRDNGAPDDFDVLQFGAGIAPGDVSATRPANNPGDLLLSLPDGGSVLIAGYQSSATGIEEIRFDDGSSWDQQQIAALADVAPVQSTSSPQVDPQTVVAPSGAFTMVRDVEVFGGPESGLLITALTGVSPGISAELERGRDIRITPDDGFSGDTHIEFEIRDAFGGVGTVRLQVTVPESNRPPVATAETFTVPQDQIAHIAGSELLASASDPDGDALHISAVNWASGGAAVVAADGSVTFTPTPGFHGLARLAYTVSDDKGASTPVVAEIDIQGAPQAATDTFEMVAAQSLTIDPAELLANDHSPSLRDLAVEGVSLAVGGGVFINASGDIVFSPDPGFSGEAGFSYSVSDGLNAPVIGQVKVEITPLPPVFAAVDDAGFETPEDQALLIALPELLTNDIQGSAQTLTIRTVSDPHGGAATLLQDGTVHFDPYADFSGLAAFSYELLGDAGQTSQARVYIAVQPVNDAPEALNDTGYSVEQGSSLTLPAADLLLNDFDRDGDPLHLTVISAVEGGAAEISADGDIVFRPAVGFSGTALIRYEISDGQLTDEATVLIEVRPEQSGGTAIASASGGVLFGAEFNDMLKGGPGQDYLQGGAGADLLDGGDGSDKADYSRSAAGVRVDLAAGTAEGGDAAGDILTGIEQLGGSRHDDMLAGDEQNNTLIGRRGADTLSGGAGKDWLEGGRGADLMLGGEGRDTASYARSAAPVEVDLASGTAEGGDAEGDQLDSIEDLYGSSFDDVLSGDAGTNTIRGNSGNDELFGAGGKDFLVGGKGADVIDGGAGWDTADYSRSKSGVHIDLALGIAEGGEADGDRLISVETLGGSAHADILRGDDAGNQLIGRGGNDSLFGAGGKDYLRGEGGDDVLTGGLGPDSFIFRKTFGDDTVTDFSAEEGDVLWFQKQALNTAAEILSAATSQGENTLLNLGPSGTVTLQGVDLLTLSEDDFRFS